MIQRSAAILSLGATILMSGAVHAADPVGRWMTEGGEATIRIAPCGGTLCGRITALREPRDPATGRAKTDENNRNARLRGRPLVGVQVIVRMTPNGNPGQWSALVYNPEDGGSYPATLTMLGAESLRLAGCMIKDMLCGGQTWTRAR